MNTQIKKIEDIFKSDYSQDNYIAVIREVFDGVNIQSVITFRKEYSNFSSHIEGCSYIGLYESPDNKKIAIFSVQLKTNSYVENSRSTQRSYVRKLIDAGNCDAAIVAFYTESESRWRLSFVRLDYEMKFDNGKFKTEEKLTPAKRYSFLLGKDEPCHTAIERFRLFITDNNYHPTLDEIEEAFSVEKVTKEFFELYCEKFYQLQEYLDGDEDFVAESQRCGFTSEQFAKKLMGQIVFLYFLQKKGWLGVNVWTRTLTEKEYNNVFYTRGAQGRIIKEHLPKIYIKQEDGNYRFNSKALDLLTDDEETLIANHMPRKNTWGSGSQRFLRTIFDWSKKDKGTFFNDYLEPLFYDALNRNRHNTFDYCVALHCRVPFLSGGLFEPIDRYDWKATNFDIPDEIFSNIVDGDERKADGILDIFDRYNFTISEDEPMEREVAIDPEMLGKVFENLLEVKDRKSKGAFYTPREIVHYMCQESLINYLVRKTGLKEQDVRDFILYGDFMKDEDTSKERREGNGGMFISEDIFKIDSAGKVVVNRLKEIDEALATVRVADPAVGSGAFPLGMVNEIVKARQNITAYITIGMKAVDKRYVYINERSTYQLKYNAIRNSIYAVDIEPSAVDIAQLRLWLSLVIDDEINPNAQTELDGHKNPLPLPNLECNILCGNSLIDEFKGTRLIPASDVLGTDDGDGMLSLTDYSSKAYVDKYLSAQKELFVCDDPNKKHELLDTIELCKAELIRKQLEGKTSEDIQEFNEVYQLRSKPFILWQLDFARVFRENGGFDIVIGNPPYVGESGHKDIFRPIASTEFGKRFYIGKMDLFYFFFHKGLDILNTDGDIALITTNYYPTATGAKKLRKDFKDRTQMRALINFNEVRVFESALGQHNMITFLTKSFKTPIVCRSVYCTESLTATPEKIKEILYGTDKKIKQGYLEQDNIFDGTDCYIRQDGVFSTGESGIGLVVDKMAQQTVHLGDIADVNQGVVTGCDTVANRNIKYIPESSNKIKNDGIYVFDLTNSRDLEVISEFSNGVELLKDFYKNSDISRYYCNTKASKKLIYFLDGLNKNNYPDVYNHLSKFKPLLEKRLETYNEHYHWTAIHRARKEEIFSGSKIVVPYRTKENAFAYNDVEWFCRSDCYVITSKNGTDLFYLLAILNSKLNYVWLYNRGKRKGEVLELFQVPLCEIPIIMLDKDNAEQISKLSKQITEIKKDDRFADTKELEEEIDKILYDAYNLSEEEMRLVEEFCSNNKK